MRRTLQRWRWWMAVFLGASLVLSVGCGDDDEDSDEVRLEDRDFDRSGCGIL